MAQRLHTAFSKFYFIYTSAAPFSFKCVATLDIPHAERSLCTRPFFFCNLRVKLLVYDTYHAAERVNCDTLFLACARQLFNENACASAINCANCHTQPIYMQRRRAGKISCSPVQPDAHQETCTYISVCICNCHKYACLLHAARQLSIWHFDRIAAAAAD
jgi:hypothetical protein